MPHGSGQLLERLWTPAARAAARLQLVAAEEPGSMQHFTTALLLGDLLARLHATFLISVLGAFEDSVSRRHSFSLVRANGGADWVRALADCEGRLRDRGLPPDLDRVVRWPVSQLDSPPQRNAFIQIAAPLSELTAGLRREKAQSVVKGPTPRLLFELLIQIRNKTVHGAYEARFYADQVDVVSDAVQWLLRETPLWDAELLYVPKRARARVLCGLAPTRATPLIGEFNRDDVVFRLGDQSWQSAPLIHVHDNDTFLANGSWRGTDTTADFLCHSMAAAEPGQGTLRLKRPTLARAPLPNVGQLVDSRYQIIQILGEGEDAVVYLAADTREDVNYVLKAFREPKEAFDQRRTEFDALRRISHPGVPRVHEIHNWEHPFHLRLDYVRAVPLETKRPDFAGDLLAVTRLGIALAEALAAVHSSGFVHRDVSPHNILIPEEPSDPVRLFDFDLVAPIGTIGPAGTSAYRPPESELGAPWTQASDVYSLGVILFELLTGRLPFVLGEGAANRQITEPTADETARFGEVVTVLLRAASVDPSARYGTAIHFMKAIRAATDSP
jgi:hypothetical protein